MTKYPQLVNVPYIEAGVQPIHLATDQGHLNVVKFLVECVSFLLINLMNSLTIGPGSLLLLLAIAFKFLSNSKLSLNYSIPGPAILSTVFRKHLCDCLHS